MDLPHVQAAVRAVNPYYVDMVTWKQEGNIIKAFPKHPISEVAFNAIKKVFKRFGGKYVSHYGKCWFELVVKENSGWSREPLPMGKMEENGSRRDIHASKRTPATVGVMTNNSPAPGSVLEHLQARIDRLAMAGAKLLEEA